MQSILSTPPVQPVIVPKVHFFRGLCISTTFFCLSIENNILIILVHISTLQSTLTATILTPLANPAREAKARVREAREATTVERAGDMTATIAGRGRATTATTAGRGRGRRAGVREGARAGAKGTPRHCAGTTTTCATWTPPTSGRTPSSSTPSTKSSTL